MPEQVRIVQSAQDAALKLAQQPVETAQPERGVMFPEDEVASPMQLKGVSANTGPRLMAQSPT